MNQEVAWDNEYTIGNGVPTSTRTTPSWAALRLMEYFRTNGIRPTDSLIDLGSGPGRNAFLFAEEGFEVTAVDFSQPALDKLNQIQKTKPDLNIKTKKVDLSKPLPFADDSFEIATDIVTSMTIEPR